MENNTQPILTALQAADKGDPTISTLAFVLAIVVIAVAIAKPIMSIVRDWKISGVDSQKAESEVSLYEQLRQHLMTLANEVEKLRVERNVWYEKSLELEVEVKRLQLFEQSFNSMKTRLEDKDKAIQERDTEIRSLTRTILEMKDRLHSLELRLQQDEKKIADCTTCMYVTHMKGDHGT
jgi:predicted RNase H-like nuclease (RuvC/YqgF family)